MQMQRYLVGIEYFGGNFLGWQKSPGNQRIKAVQSWVEEALDKFVGNENHDGAVISSRTDKGVHALRNVFHVDIRRRRRQVGEPMPAYKPLIVQRALNSILREQKASILDVQAVNPEFHARFHATGRTYCYRICTSCSQPSVFNRDYVWAVPQQLDLACMQEASTYLLGTHDFSSFRSAGCQARTPIRTISELNVNFAPTAGLPIGSTGTMDGKTIEVTIKGNAFLYHMVRNIVGALYKVGTGEVRPTYMKELLQKCNKGEAPPPAPPTGLFLVDVHYGGISDYL